MKRRLLTVLCLLFIVLNLFPCPVSAVASGECGDNARWSLSDSGVLTISGSGAIYDYIYEGANMPPLTKAPWRGPYLDNPLQADKNYTDKIKKIVINSGITRIGDNVFCCLPNVTSVSIPNTVTSIGQAAFADDTSLKNVNIPSSVTTIEKSAFKNCKSLTSVKLPSKLTSLPEGIFYGCKSLGSIDLPPKITVISATAFSFCGSLKSIIIPEGVTEIQDEAFAYGGLTSIKLPESLQIIGNNAFATAKLTQITIPANVTQIRRHAFELCKNLQRIQFMGSAPSFDAYAFMYTTTTAYYPKNDPSWTESVRQNYNGTITWVAHCGTEHAWGQWETALEASCFEAGLETRTCTQCTITEEKSIAKIAHKYDAVVTPPTCKSAGFTTHTCEVCKNTYKDDKKPAEAHTFGEWIVIKEATCLEKGSRQHSCIACNAQVTEEIELSGHTYRDEVTAPSCTQKGFTTHTCTVCEHTFVDAYTELAEHTYGAWTEVKPATRWEKGEQHRQCVDCAQVQTGVLPKPPVNWGLTIGIIAAGAAVVACVITAIVAHKKRHTMK